METSAGNQENTKRSRSLKKLNKNREMSIEKDFIKQHIEAFDFMINNYLKQIFGDHDLGT